MKTIRILGSALYCAILTSLVGFGLRMLTLWMFSFSDLWAAVTLFILCSVGFFSIFALGMMLFYPGIAIRGEQTECLWLNPVVIALSGVLQLFLFYSIDVDFTVKMHIITIFWMAVYLFFVIFSTVMASKNFDN